MGAMATIRQRRSGVWEVRVYLGCDPIIGKKRQRSRVVYGTKQQASTVAAAMEADRDSAHAPTAMERTVGDLLRAWYAHGEASWSVATAAGYRSRIKLVSPTPVGRASVAELTTEALDRWYLGLVRAGVSPANIRNHHAMLRRALNHGVRWGWLPSNPALAASPPRVPTRRVVAMRAGDVIAAANAAADESLLTGLCVRLAAVTGARRGELVGLQWDDLDGELLTISRNVTTVSLGNAQHHQRVQLNVGATKTHSRRRITLDVESVALLWRWREECETRARAIGAELGPWIVSEAAPNASPCSPDWLTRVWARARRQASLAPHWRLHDLRHWAATTMIAAGEDVRLVAGRLGHARAATTLDVYAHFIECSDGRGADALAARLANVETDTT
jgi:integrase